MQVIHRESKYGFRSQTRKGGKERSGAVGKCVVSETNKTTGWGRLETKQKESDIRISRVVGVFQESSIYAD